MFTAALVSALVGVGVSLVVSLIGATAKGAAAVGAVKAFENIFSISNLDWIKGFDEPYTSIASLAIYMLGNFMLYARTLVILCAFLSIIFYSFKLWSGTLELKKLFADSIYKAVMVSAIMLIYPTVINRTYNLATSLGVEASGGYTAVYTSFSNLAARTKEIWERGSEEYFKAITQGCEKDKDGNYVISEKALNAFIESGMSEEEAIAWAKNHGIVVSDEKLTKETKKAIKKAKKTLNSEQKKKMMKQSLAIVRGLTEVLTGTSDVQLQDGSISATELMNMGEDTLDTIFYNPYIGESNTLSASAMIKTGIIISDIASSGCLTSVTDSFSEEKNPSMKEISEGDVNIFLKFLSVIFKSFVYKLGMLVAMILIMCEYIICLIEYLIVAAVSCLLIPLFFIDATKQFAANLLRMILSYFVKILVTTMMCFFVLVLYIDLGAAFCSKSDLSSISTILLYVFTIVLGLILVKNSGKIAGSVISGNPSMGLGDIANQMHSMGHAMHSAAHVAQAAKQMYSSAQQTGQGIVRGGMDAYGSYAAANNASSMTKNNLQKSRESGLYSGSDKDISRASRGAFWNTVGNAASQKIGDKFAKSFTGNERQHLDEKGENNGFLKVGQEFYDGQRMRKATYADVKEAADKFAQKNAESSVNKSGAVHNRQTDHDYGADSQRKIELPEDESLRRWRR